jgi:hypothetical protein
MMAMETDRLYDVLASFWPAAMAGKVAAGTMVLNCIKTRIEAYGKIPEDLEAVKSADGTPRTLVISPEDYEASLRRIGQ